MMKLGIHRKYRAVLRWDRYARRCQKIAGTSRVPATRGYTAAYNRWAAAWNKRNYLEQRHEGA